MTTTWRDSALCRELTPEAAMAIFYPESGSGRRVDEANAAAKKMCWSCPVRLACAEAGDQEYFGTWGGTTATERQRARRVARTDCANCGRRLSARWADQGAQYCCAEECRSLSRREARRRYREKAG